MQNEGLDNPFSEPEVWAAIMASPSEKVPGPDGFSGTFFRACWGTIKNDAMAVFDHFYNLAEGDFAEINSAMIALIPKKDGATRMNDYRPISLIHSIAKLITKVLSMRLTVVIEKIISLAQTAFQCRKCIHDSYFYVQNSVRALHRNKTPMLLLKLDISRDFDSIPSEYLFELLQRLGLSAGWRDWIALLLPSSSTSCIINGDPGDLIFHLRGLRQGDPPLAAALHPLHRPFASPSGRGHQDRCAEPHPGRSGEDTHKLICRQCRYLH